MKTKLSVLVLLSMVCFSGFSQGEDPLVKQSQGVFKVKTKDEMAKNEGKLTGKGKAAFEKAKNDYKNIKDAKFEIAPNEQLNQDPSELMGIPKSEKPDFKIAEQQKNENRKNQDEIKGKLEAAGVAITVFDLINSTGAPISITCSWQPNTLTPVKNQGSCGSCWAFAAVAAMEHAYAKFKGVKLDLSEQEVISCGVSCGGNDCGSCGGGWSHPSLDYMKCKGITNEVIFPYTATNASCKVTPKLAYASTWGQLYPGRFPTVDEIKSFVSTFGSVVTYMKAGLNTFLGYGGGVYNGYPSNSNNELDHAVTIVGWCNSMNAWVIKNSWGEGWGPYGGYAYVGYNQCNIGKYVYWVFPRL